MVGLIDRVSDATRIQLSTSDSFRDRDQRDNHNRGVTTNSTCFDFTHMEIPPKITQTFDDTKTPYPSPLHLHNPLPADHAAPANHPPIRPVLADQL